MSRSRRWGSRALLALSVGAATVTLHDLAQARKKDSLAAPAEGSKRLAVYVEGKNANAIYDQLVALGPDGLEVLDRAEFAKAIRGAGLPATLSYSLQNKSGRKILLKNLNKAVSKVGADAFVVARETLVGKKHELQVIFALKGAENAELDEKLDLGSNDRAQRKALKDSLEQPLKALAPPPPPEPEPTPPAEEEKKEDEGEASSGGAMSAEYRQNTAGYELVAARLGFVVGGRWFKYSDAVTTDNSRPYAVFGPPGLTAGVDVYPGAKSGIVGLRDLGVSIDYAQHFALRSKTAQNPDGSDSATFDGTWNRLDVGLRYRLRLGDPASPLVLGLGVGYGFENFVFTPANPAAEAIKFEVPTVRYDYVKLGFDAWLPFGMFAVGPRFAYLAPLGGALPDDKIPGPGLDGSFAPEPVDDTVYARFRGASVKGITAGLDAGVTVGSGIEVRAGFDYVRYFSAFKPDVGDAFVAGGALDEVLEVRALAGYRY
ncbi:MAG: hypothetical protein FJ096_13920 [Deltaproteobacteria bacterium]|nr:hypothetical protein [Deltaproteobacteria bacterium]